MTTALDTPMPSATAPHATSSPPPAWRVMAALARVEGVRMLRHPATLLATAAATASAAVSFWQDPAVLPRDAPLLGVFASMIGVGVLLAAQLATSRLRRDELEPLAGILPTSALTRTAGLLAGLVWPALAATLWCAGGLAVLALAGGVGRPAVGDVLAPFATVLVAGAIGVAIGRWLPWAVAGIASLPCLLVGLIVLTQAWYERPLTRRLLPTPDWFPSPGEGWIETWPRDLGLHLLYVLLIAGVLAGIALLRDRRGVAIVGGLAACLAGTVLAAGQLLAVWDDPDRVASLVRDVQDPDRRLRCAAEDGIEVCLPDGYASWATPIRDQVRTAHAMLPDGPPHTLRVMMRSPRPSALLASMPEDVVGLPEDVKTLTVQAWVFQHVLELPEPGVVDVHHRRRGGDAGDAQRLDLALGVIGQATGMPLPERVAQGMEAPLDEPGLHDGCAPRYAAVEVLTFALAARSHPSAHEALERELTAWPYGWFAPAPGVYNTMINDHFHVEHGATTTPATSSGRMFTMGVTAPWSRGAATLGLALAEVASVADLHVDWDRWVDPATPAEALLDTFGLDPLPTPVELAVEAGIADQLVFDPRCTGAADDRSR